MSIHLTGNIHRLDVGSKTFKGIYVVLFKVFKDEFINNESYMIHGFLVGCQKLLNIITRT